MDKDVVCMYNGILVIRKNEILPFETTWIDLEGIMLNEMSDRERQILYNLTYMWNLKTKTQSKEVVHQNPSQI